MGVMLPGPCYSCVSDIGCGLPLSFQGRIQIKGAWSSQSCFTSSCGEAVFGIADACCVFIWKPDLACSSQRVPSPSLDMAEAQVRALPEEVGAGGEAFLSQCLAEGAEEGGEQGKCGRRLVQGAMGSKFWAVNL